MRHAYNPLSRINTFGIVAVCLSPCLLGVESRGDSWIEQHVLVVLGFGFGLFLTALRRSIVVEPDAIVVSLGLWPIIVTRRTPVSCFTCVEADAAWSKGGTTYYVVLNWIEANGLPGRSRLMNGGYDYMEAAGNLAKDLSIPLTTTPGFEKNAGEEGRKMVARFADALVTTSLSGSDALRASAPRSSETGEKGHER